MDQSRINRETSMSAPQGETLIGTAGGTTLTIVAAIVNNLQLGEIIMSAVIGTVVSFLVMETLKWIKSKIINRDGKK